MPLTLTVSMSKAEKRKKAKGGSVLLLDYFRQTFSGGSPTLDFIPYFLSILVASICNRSAIVIWILFFCVSLPRPDRNKVQIRRMFLSGEESLPSVCQSRGHRLIYLSTYSGIIMVWLFRAKRCKPTHISYGI